MKKYGCEETEADKGRSKRRWRSGEKIHVQRSGIQKRRAKEERARVYLLLVDFSPQIEEPAGEQIGYRE